MRPSRRYERRTCQSSTYFPAPYTGQMEEGLDFLDKRLNGALAVLDTRLRSEHPKSRIAARLGAHMLRITKMMSVNSSFLVIFFSFISSSCSPDAIATPSLLHLRQDNTKLMAEMVQVVQLWGRGRTSCLNGLVRIHKAAKGYCQGYGRFSSNTRWRWQSGLPLSMERATSEARNNAPAQDVQAQGSRRAGRCCC